MSEKESDENFTASKDSCYNNYVYNDQEGFCSLRRLFELKEIQQIQHELANDLRRVK